MKTNYKITLILILLTSLFFYTGKAFTVLALPSKPNLPNMFSGPNEPNFPEDPQFPTGPEFPGQPQLPPCVECDEFITEATPNSTIKPAPTASPNPSTNDEDDDNDNNDNDSGDDSDSDNGEVQGVSIGGPQVLGATGTVEDSIFYTLFSFGSLLTSLGIMKNAKKKAYN